jgi:hypothetical protein
MIDDDGVDSSFTDSNPSAADALALAKRAEEKRLAAFRAVMATPEGRRWIWWLLDRCGVFRTSFTGDNATFFNEGSRNVGLMVIADINAACPDFYLTMMTEAKDPHP